MLQFAVHKNTHAANKARVPFLLDVQSDLIAELVTRVVVPLYTRSSMKGLSISTLTPVFDIEGKQCVMLTPQLAGVSKKLLGTQVATLATHRNEIIAALDLLITGI